MNLDELIPLWDKHGSYNADGYWIENHQLWDYYADRPKLYKRKKRLALIWWLVPVVGIILVDIKFNDMGLSYF